MISNNLDIEIIARMTTRSQSTPAYKKIKSDKVPEAQAKELTLLNVQDIVRTQGYDCLCRVFRDIVGTFGSKYSIDAREMLICTSPLNGCIQIMAQ